MPEDPTVVQKADQIARLAAERAATLTLLDAAKTTALAVERAVKDANIDRDLREHAKHLEAINGSQREMAASLRRVEDTLERQATATKAIGSFVKDQDGARLSRRTIAISMAVAVAAWVTLLALMLTKPPLGF